MSALSRMLVYREAIYGGADGIDTPYRPFHISGAILTGYNCSFSDGISNGGLSVSRCPIKKRKVDGSYVYTADVSIVPDTSFGLPASLTSVTASPTASSYTYSNGNVRIIWSSAPTANATATINATCPISYTGSELSKGVLGYMRLG